MLGALVQRTVAWPLPSLPDLLTDVFSTLAEKAPGRPKGVTGAEGAGLSRLVRETCDQIVSIPIASTVESLNAAVATGIALYEVASLRAQG